METGELGKTDYKTNNFSVSILPCKCRLPLDLMKKFKQAGKIRYYKESHIRKVFKCT